jgi:integrase
VESGLWKPAVAAIGRPELTFRCTRHFYASALIRRGQDAVVVARRLRNSPAMVHQTYAHLWHGDDDRSREAINETLRPSAGNHEAAEPGA